MTNFKDEEGYGCAWPIPRIVVLAMIKRVTSGNLLQ